MSLPVPYWHRPGSDESQKGLCQSAGIEQDEKPLMVLQAMACVGRRSLAAPLALRARLLPAQVLYWVYVHDKVLQHYDDEGTTVVRYELASSSALDSFTPSRGFSGESMVASAIDASPRFK